MESQKLRDGLHLEIQWCIFRLMKFLLYPPSLLYRSVCWFKSLAYRWKIIQAKKAPIPVVSVGNISFGGAEKTPLSMNLISALIERDYKPALISRGYRSRWEKRGGILSDGQSLLGDWQDSGDEPFMAAQNFKRTGIFVGKDRISSCQKAKDLGFNIAVLDDGFQHLRLHRDVDIVMVTPDEKIILRESLSSLKRSHLVLIKDDAKAHNKDKLKIQIPQAYIYSYHVTLTGLFLLGSDQSVPLEVVKNKKILAFCGIASPYRFTTLLKSNGITPHTFLRFKDHHPYPPATLNKIKNTWESTKAEAAITTEKDAVKISDRIKFEKIPVYYVKIDLDIEPGFYLRLFSMLKDKEKHGP